MASQTTAVSGLPSRSVLLPFAVFILLVGGAPVAMRIGYAEMAPFWMGVARFGLGALVFWGLVFYKGLKFPQGRALLGAVLHGTLGVGISFILISWGLIKTQASMTSILLALVPLMTLLLSSLQGVESFSWRGILGALLAIAGTAIAVGGASAENISLPHIGAIILATVFSAQSSVVIKRFPPNPPILTNAISMTVGSIILAITSLVTRETWVIPSQTNTWVAFGYLVIFVTIIAFLFYLQVLAKWTASGTSYGFVVIPLVTVIVSAVLTDEHITSSFLAGAVLIIAGVVVGALLPSKQNAEAVEECKDLSGQALPRCY